jgi:hypothetical protein
VVHACELSHEGGIGKRIATSGWLRPKKKPKKKINIFT